MRIIILVLALAAFAGFAVADVNVTGKWTGSFRGVEPEGLEPLVPSKANNTPGKPGKRSSTWRGRSNPRPFNVAGRDSR